MGTVRALSSLQIKADSIFHSGLRQQLSNLPGGKCGPDKSCTRTGQSSARNVRQRPCRLIGHCSRYVLFVTDGFMVFHHLAQDLVLQRSALPGHLVYSIGSSLPKDWVEVGIVYGEKQ
ncbi:hypothetical protein RRG08_029876 [Elysia crispata]|uniref:Uncharacterized protein n=1 Tax=Elysia crispata TaxID=231223 RepID=A0AAE0YJC1_9GAST|nr:hypothetical protein RRG08_029876 [Elysia crispata]